MPRSLILACLLVASTVVCPPVLLPQGTDLGSVRGMVTDASGAAVPKATVVITDMETETRLITASNEAGEYEANSLKPGNYKITVSAPGFSSVEITGLTLRAG